MSYAYIVCASYQKVVLRLFLNDKLIEGAGASDAYFCGEGFIESLGVDLSAEDKGNISIGIKGSGLLDLFINNESVKIDNRRNVL